MRIGLLGPAERAPDGGSSQAFREAVLFLLGDAEADQVVYLGSGELAERELDAWAREMGGEDPEASFLRTAAEIAPTGTPEAIEALLARDALVARLAAVRRLPPPPARALEMIDDRVVLFVHDKAILDEEDIANAHLIVYGKSNESEFRRFGRRAFFTPGPLAKGRVGVLEAGDEGVTLALFDVSGVPLWREAIFQGGTKVTVAT
jgi:hypothetical protein